MCQVVVTPLPSRWCRWAVGVCAALVLTSPVFGQNARQASRAETAPTSRATSLARFIPDGNFAFYAEFEGLDNHAAAWQASAAYKVLNATTLGALLADVAAQGVDAALGNARGRGLTGAEVVAKAQLFVRRGAAVAISREGPGKTHSIFVFRGGSGPDVRGLLDTLANSMAAPKGIKANLTNRGREMTRYGEGEGAYVIWAEKGDAVVCDLASAAAVLDTIDGRRVSAEGNATRVGLVSRGAGYETVGLAFLDAAKLGPLPAEAVKMGFDGLKRVEFQLGFQGDALMSVIRLRAPSPRKGGSPFSTSRPSTLPPYPRSPPD